MFIRGRSLANQIANRSALAAHRAGFDRQYENLPQSETWRPHQKLTS